MNSLNNASESNICSKSVRKHCTSRNTRKKYSVHSQEFHKRFESNVGSGSTFEFLSKPECSLPNAFHGRRYSNRSNTNNSTNKRAKQRVSITEKKYIPGIFQGQSDKQASEIQDWEYDLMGGPIRNDRTESNRCGVLSKSKDLKDMKKILLSVKNQKKENESKNKNIENEEKIEINDENFRWTQLYMRKCELVSKLSLFIKERGNLSEKDKFKICFNYDKAPLLVITCSGRLCSAIQVEEEIEKKIMEIVKKDTKLFEDEVKIVLDLKQLRDVYSYALECILIRWMNYLNNRAKKIVIIIPESVIKNILIDVVQSYRIKARSFLPNCEYYVVSRSRDVNSLI